MNKALDTLNIKRAKLTTLQVNLGNLCNQSCSHCHIEAGPSGKEIMPLEVVNNVLSFLSKTKDLILDITGGAPELNPHFDYLIRSGSKRVKEIIVRSNLTVLLEKGKEHLSNFFKENKVHLICSLPCYTEENVDRQRGAWVFQKSVKALQILNTIGFGMGNGLQLDLVHNPISAGLAFPQEKLESEYKSALSRDYKVSFNRLLTITNAPIGRFKHYLEEQGKFKDYVQLLEDNFNPSTLENLMCRNLLSMGFSGLLYDCDFNLALGLKLNDEFGRCLTIADITPEDWQGREIILGQHCFACSAGTGSGCQGALVQDKVLKRDEVKSFYSAAAIQPKKELCCPVSYDREDVSFIPKEVLEVSYGCASPMSLAQPKQNEVVLDLGSGAGIDCFIAAKKVGPAGRVIGVDMTEEMLNKANRAQEEVASQLGYLNCEFRKGFLEEVPVEAESIDLVTSNCVLNLSADKKKVFAEIFRILKSSGRFVISDIISDKAVPLYMQKDSKLWGECISGALTQNEFLGLEKAAGFYGLEVLKNFKYKEAEGIQFCSITVRGYKFKKGANCVYIGQYATYLGPYSEIRDDDNHIFPRGQAIEICTDTASKLTQPPYAGKFLITSIKKDGSPNPCCPSDTEGKPCC